MARNYNINGLMEWAASFIPQNLNIKAWLVDVFDVLGASQPLESVQELIDFHPFKMKKGQSFTIVDYPNGGVNTTYVLNTDPLLLVDGNEDSIVTLDNWLTFYDQQASIQTSKDIVYQYAPNYLGGQPLYPYTSDNALREERDGTWHAVQNKAAGDKWFRTRDDDSFTMYTDPDAGPDIKVYDNWTRPLPFGAVSTPGDYINNRYKREVEGATGIAAAGSLVIDTFYLVVTGLVTATRVSDGTDFLLGAGATFEKTAAFTYVYTDAGTTCNTLPDIPPRTTAGGLPNNEPAGYSDVIPTAVDPLNPVQLWLIWSHKSVHGQLKSEWILEKVIEDPELLRYSRKSTPHPDTLMGVNDSINDLYAGSEDAYIGLTFDEILDLEGWKSVYVEGQTDFISTRSDDGGSPPWTGWAVSKIGDESGEYTDYAYKLFPVNTPSSTLLASKPIASDPSGEGFNSNPLEETGTDKNYVSSCRKYFDGTLKTDWSDLVPWTGADVYQDSLLLPDGNDFKYDPNDPVAPTVPQPSELRMVGELRKGLTELWNEAGVTLAFKWEKTFDNGSAINPATEIVSVNKADSAYVKSVSGIPAAGTITSSGTAVAGSGTSFTTEFNVNDYIKVSSGQVRQIATITDDLNLVLYLAFTPDIAIGEDIENSFMTEEELAAGYQDGQILVIKHDYVTGKAYFRLTTTLSTVHGDMVFVTPVDILDITDGLDRKALEIGSDGQLCIYDTGNETFNPPTFLLSSMFANLPWVTAFNWFFNNGSGYTKITGAEANFAITGAKDNVLSILIESLPVAKTGTVTTTGTAVLGVGTLFTTEFAVGQYIKVSSGQVRKIVTITDALNIVVDPAFSPDVAAETIELVENIFDRDTDAQQLQIALSTHSTDPTLADGENELSDYLTIAKSSSAAIGTDGEDAPVAILTQEAYTTVLDASTNIPLAGELGTAGNVQTDIIVYSGENRLDYNAGDFSVVKGADPTGITTQAIRVSPIDSNNANLWVETGGWVANTRSGKVTLTITLSAAYGSTVIVKEFAMASTKDAPGAIFLDIDTPQGFSFDRNPGGLDDKTLTARLYDVIAGVQTELGPTNYYYQWEGPVFRTWTQGAGGSNGDASPPITKASIFADAVVICKVSESVTGSPILRQASVRITDITDSKTYRLYSSEVSEPAKPINATDPEATQGVWSKTLSGAVWASDGSELKDASNPVVYEFSEPYEVKGTVGDQGPNGGFMLAMYKNFTAGTPGTIVSDTQNLTVMEAAGWTYKPPIVVQGSYLWMVQRPYVAWRDDQTTPVSFDGNGKPNYNGTPSADSAEMDGSKWIGPMQQSGFDGVNGDLYEFRYAKNTSTTVPPTLATSSRTPAGWSLTYPSRTSGEYVWETKAQINGETDALIGTWATPTLKTGEAITGPPGPAPAHQWNGTELRFFNPNGSPGDYTDLVGPAGPAWTDPAWLTLSATYKVYYRRDGAGFTHLYKSGTRTTTIPVGTVLGTLPVNFRPRYDGYRLVGLEGIFGALWIEANGQVQTQSDDLSGGREWWVMFPSESLSLGIP